MVNYYKKSLLDCLEALHKARKDPMKDPLKWKVLQEKLIRRHFYLESRIKKNKEEIKHINKIRKNPIERLTKEESVNAKNSIDYLEYQNEEYHWLINCYKSIGDGIAYTFISRYDIKPQVFKQDAGFMSGKIGYKAEKQLFNQAFKVGMVAIIHDLTSVLRFRDITLVDDEGYVPIEVKTSSNTNQRVSRQKENADQLFEYLYNDQAECLFGTQQKIVRVEMLSEEIHHIGLLNKLIKRSAIQGQAIALAERGLLYVVGHNEEGFDAKITSALARQKMLKPIAHYLNARKFSEMGYYPFSLSIQDPKEYINFLEGRLIIILFMEQAVLEEYAQNFGYKIVPTTKEDYVLTFKALWKGNSVVEFSVGQHFLDRIGMEFNSMKWTYQEMFTRMNAKDIAVD
ncbi:hypothetical protein EZ428_19280 [Pedobacter frigiditerrae]|uniref:Uncharacterized protein n=1 Tax=Pedobacter frigiditerrae TaxID=2530452 RepID=A0A4R0MQ30_9SPHI|nr:hypothetical protein [Pedobacter frigiditerrae]TCC88773.1 hypothetical protein EZ428_19280 [Pedobacter frigiditerrae]